MSLQSRRRMKEWIPFLVHILPGSGPPPLSLFFPHLRRRLSRGCRMHSFQRLSYSWTPSAERWGGNEVDASQRLARRAPPAGAAPRPDLHQRAGHTEGTPLGTGTDARPPPRLRRHNPTSVDQALDPAPCLSPAPSTAFVADSDRPGPVFPLPFMNFCVRTRGPLLSESHVFGLLMTALTTNCQPPPTANRHQPPTANHYSILFLWSCVLPMSRP